MYKVLVLTKLGVWAYCAQIAQFALRFKTFL